MNAIPNTAPASTGMVDLLLRERAATDTLCADQDQAAAILPRLLGIAAIGVAAWAAVEGGLLVGSAQVVFPEALAGGPWWWAPVALFVAYETAFLGVQLAGLPSFYFYGLLAGIRTHGWRIAVESLRARATAAVVLLGVLPVYLAVGLGLVLVFPDSTVLGMTLHTLFLTVGGMALPFLCGLAAPLSLYRAFTRMVAEVQVDGATRRRPMPVVLVLAWSVFFSVLAPLGAWRVLTLLSDPSLIPWLAQ
jgi:hypothetical protein